MSLTTTSPCRRRQSVETGAIRERTLADSFSQFVSAHVSYIISSPFVLGPDRLPSVCSYTIMNSDPLLCSASLSDDSAMLATGYSDCKIRVFSVTKSSLRTMRHHTELAEIDPEADDVLDRIMDTTSAAKEKVLYAAHAGSILATSFTPDKRFLISACADGSLRLWNLWLWSNLATYKCHMFPVTDVEFSPMGYYFGSCGTDRAARIWATEYINPLRMLVGHNDDITKIHFHPNANYVATASCDRTVRMWDISTGNCVRYFTGHKDIPQVCSNGGNTLFLRFAFIYTGM